jgi:archaellum component FlaC
MALATQEEKDIKEIFVEALEPFTRSIREDFQKVPAEFGRVPGEFGKVPGRLIKVKDGTNWLRGSVALLDRKTDEIKQELSGKIDTVEQKLSGKIDTVQQELSDIKKKLENVIYRHDFEAPKNESAHSIKKSVLKT